MANTEDRNKRADWFAKQNHTKPTKTQITKDFYDPILTGGGGLAAPTIPGTPLIFGQQNVGSTLTVSPAGATGNPTPTITYQWVNSVSGDIVGATGASYTLQASDLGDQISVRQIATNSEGSANKTSALTGAIGAQLTAPTIPGVPTISGTEAVGSVLTATPSTPVTGNPSPTRSWQWVNSVTGDIAGATNDTYTLQASDQGDQISVRQTESNSEGADSATSALTGAISGSAIAPSIPGVPTISGTERVGETLTATPSTPVTGNPTPTRTWQWVNSVSGDIAGATGTTYVLQASDEGDQISVRQIETNSEGSANKTSVLTGVIDAVLAAPSIPGVPTISGTAEVGQVLTATPSTPVTGNPTPTRTWQWVNSVSGDIAGATNATYAPQASDVGDTITVRQIETNSQGSDTATSASTGTVADQPVAPSIPGSPIISGTLTEGSTLTATPSTPVTGFPTPSRTWQWLRNSVAISGATSATYVLTPTDVGTQISVTQTETNASGSDSTTSSQTAAISGLQVTLTSVSYNGTDTITATTNKPTTIYWSITDNSSESATNVINGTGAYDNGSYSVSSGSNNGTIAYPNTPTGNHYLHIVADDATSPSPSTVDSTQYSFVGAPTVPATMVDADWSVATGPSGGEITFTVAQAPANGGAAITKYQYTTDSGSTWRDSGLTATGSVDLDLQSDGSTAFTEGQSYNFQVRAVNSVGNAAASNTESATAAVTPTVPATMVAADWGVATGSSVNEIDISVTTAPDDGGSSLIRYEYTTDNEATWRNTGIAGTTGSATVNVESDGTTSLGDGQSHDFKIRAVNSVGNAAASNIESATSGASASGIQVVGTPTVFTDGFPVTSGGDSGSLSAVNFTPANVNNIVVIDILWERNDATSLDTSVDSGGANVGTVNGNAALHARSRNTSRRQCTQLVFHPNTTSATSYTFDPAGTMRAAHVVVTEYSGVDTTTPVNAAGNNVSAGDTVSPTLTTVDAAGMLHASATFSDETLADPTGGTVLSNGNTGADTKDIAYVVANQAVVAAAASEGITFTQTGNVSAVGCILELNPA